MQDSGYFGGMRHDPRRAMQLFLVLDGAVRLLVWTSALSLSAVATAYLVGRPPGVPYEADFGWAWRWGRHLATWVILFNFFYVLVLIVLRLPIPKPREGRYALDRPVRLATPEGRQLLWSCLIAVLTKARYEAPFPAFLVYQFSVTPPLSWLMGPIFGPRSRSYNATNPCILDPHLVSIGRNTVIGYNTTIAGHIQERDAVYIRRTVIEDDVMVGGHAVIPGGVHIGRGAMIGTGAIVLPDTVIGPNEFWAGVPARKIKDLPAVGPRA